MTVSLKEHRHVRFIARACVVVGVRIPFINGADNVHIG